MLCHLGWVGRDQRLSLLPLGSHLAHYVVPFYESIAVQRLLDFFRNEKSAERKSPWPPTVLFRVPGRSEACGWQAVSLRTQRGPVWQLGPKGVVAWRCGPAWGLSVVPGAFSCSLCVWISTLEKGYGLNCAPPQFICLNPNPDTSEYDCIWIKGL